MPRNPQDPPFKSSLHSRKRNKEGKLRYETSVPLKVANDKGKWTIEILEDNTMIWDKAE